MIFSVREKTAVKKCLGLLAFLLFALAAPAEAQSGAALSGELVKWHPVTLSFDGPEASEGDLDPNPFLDYRLQLTLTAPSGRTAVLPGFFAGDGNGGGSGNVWQVRFAPDEAGAWQYLASFRAGPDVAVELNPEAGTAVAFDGASGEFVVAGLDGNAPGFLKWGRLEYNGSHYLKFRDGPYWIKGGADSPENFLGYRGFDNTVDQGGLVPGFLHQYRPHTADWNEGDPTFSSADTGDDGRGIIGALNYLELAGVNSIYFLPMNLGGDGQETYPFIVPSGSHEDNTHYDLSKLHQWNIVLDHAQRRGIALHIVLAETEVGNYNWLDGGAIGVERKLYFREMIARFGYILALKWNLSEENHFSLEQLRESAAYIQALDESQHPITAHTPSNIFDMYVPMLGDPLFSATAMQYDGDRAGEYVETWREQSAAAGRPWVIDMDENNPAGVGLTGDNQSDLRKRILYDVYFSGGNIEWYMGYHDLPLGGDVQLENFRTREGMWQYMAYARTFMADNLPFWEMNPADELLTGESEAYGGGEVLAKAGESYAIYLPSGQPAGVLDLSADPAEFEQRWFNPRSGEFEGEALTVPGGGLLALAAPPSAPAEDWVVLLQRLDEGPLPAAPDAAVSTPTTTPAPAIPTPEEAPVAVALATSLAETTPAVTMIAVPTLPPATPSPTLLPILPTLAVPTTSPTGYSQTEATLFAIASLGVAIAAAATVFVFLNKKK
jgi:hypothetical protein